MRRAVLTTATLLAALALTACDNGKPTGAAAPSSGPRTHTAAPVTSPTASPSPTGPTLPPATDGKDIHACYDGSCEVQVRAPMNIPMSPKTGVAKLTVTAVTAEGVQVSGRMTNGNNMEVTVFADPGSLATTSIDNKVEIAALGVVDGVAVIRISPPA